MYGLTRELNSNELNLLKNSVLNKVLGLTTKVRYLLVKLVVMFSLFGGALSLPIIATMSSAYAAIDVYQFDSPQQEAQYRGLIDELRCPKCQNQNLAGSDSQIAQDLKRKVYEMVQEGQTDTQIREYMFERYGDFISYKPPVRPSTWILWFFPPIFLLSLISWWLWRNAKRSRLIKPAYNNGVQPAHNDTAIERKVTAHGSDSGLSLEEQSQLNDLLTKHTKRYDNE